MGVLIGGNFHEIESVDILNSIFEEKVGNILELLAPMKIIQLRNFFRNWVDTEIKNAMGERDSWRDIARRTDLDQDWARYRQLRNSCTKMLKNKKNNYINALFEAFDQKHDVRNMFRTTKTMLGWTSLGQPTCFMLGGGVLLRKPLDLANTLQNVFENKIKKLMRELKKDGRDPLETLKWAMGKWEKSENLPILKLKEISLIETQRLISKLGNSSAFGRDELNAMAIKTASDFLAPKLMHIINSSIRNKSYAMKWKLARIIPLQKSKEASRLDPSSFRPVSLLPMVSKLVERAVQIQIQQHFETQHLFHPNSHAYRMHKSTTTAVLQVTDKLYQATDRNMITSIMAIDQSSAFDCVSHNLLLEKLKIYGCHENTVEWIKNYLESRSQYVNVGRFDSRIVSLSIGVPQGSILGPILYSIYTNEIAETIVDKNCNNEVHDKTNLFSRECENCGTVVTYADDATLVTSNKLRVMNQLRMNVCLAKLESYLNNNELAINTSKTAILELMIKQKRGRTLGEPPHLMVVNPQKPNEMLKIKDSKNFRILGANLQPNISWQAHLEEGKKALLPGIRQQLGAMQQITKQIPRKCRKYLAEGLIMSRFSYLITLWGGATQNYMNAAQRLQNKLARWVTGSGRKTRVSSLLEQCGWMTISETTSYQTLVQLWKILRLQKPENMKDRFELNDQELILITRPRLQFTELGFRYRAANEWNRLPLEVRELRSLPLFKKRAKRWIFERRILEPD